jgi:FemAB-related protein (PEP-CTERM system-associated)
MQLEQGLQVERVRESSRWNRVVEENGGPVFARWEWGTLCEEYGHDVFRLGVSRDGRLQGVLPLVDIRSRLFGDKLVSMPFSEYGSVVLADGAPPGAAVRLLERTRKLADERDVNFVSLRGRSLEEPPGFTRKQRFVTFEIPLAADPEENWQRLDSSRRGHVRSGRENDLVVRQATSLEDLRRYYDLYLDNMRGFGTPPHSFAFFRRLWEEFGAVVEVDLAEHDGRLVNGQIVFRFADRCFHWGAVSDHDYRDLQGGSLLLWNSIEQACLDGHDTYTLGRTREGTGVYMYKKSWGGEKVWFDDYHYFPNGEYDLPNPESDEYDLAQDVWGRLPLRVTALIGPQIRKNISL